MSDYDRYKLQSPYDDENYITDEEYEESLESYFDDVDSKIKSLKETKNIRKKLN